MTDVVLKTQELQLRRRGFGPVSLEFERGQISLLCGTSGSGKSTLCQLLSEMQEPSHGQLCWNETTVGYIAHEFESQLVGATVEEELTIGAGPGNEPLQNGLCEALQKLEEPLFTLRRKDPHELSKALQQHLLLASLVRSGARFLILDESMAYLDTPARERFSSCLSSLAEAGCTILLVSHQEALLEIVDQVIVLERGETVYTGGVEAFRSSFFERAGFRQEGPSDTLISRLAELPDSGDGVEVTAREHHLNLPVGTSLAIGGFSGAGSSRALNGLMRIQHTEGWQCQPESQTDCLLRQQVAPSFWRSTCGGEIQASRGAFASLPKHLEESVLNSIPAAWLSKPPWHLSHGQMRFFGASCLILQMPRILFLDHPFQGLDGILRERLRYSLSEYLKLDGRVVLTTYFPEQLDGLGHQGIWIEEGRVAWAGVTARGEWGEFCKRL